MKLKLAFVLIALAGFQTTALAYRFTFSNHTNKPLNVQFQLAADGAIWQQELQPDTSWEKWFKWPHEEITTWENNRRAGYCLGSIKIQEWKRLKSGRMGFGAWREVNIIYIESNAYDILIKAAENFINGVISAAKAAAEVITGSTAATAATSKTLGVAKKMGGAEKKSDLPTEFKIEKLGIIKSIGDFIIYSKCRNRHFDIIQDESSVWVTTLAE